jgi:hypothetical protein
MPSAKQILKQLQAEVDEARDVIVNEIIAPHRDFDDDDPMEAMVREYRERVARLDKAKGE